MQACPALIRERDASDRLCAFVFRALIAIATGRRQLRRMTDANALNRSAEEVMHVNMLKDFPL